MKKRTFLLSFGAAAAAAALPFSAMAAAGKAWRRVRPTDAAWPGPAAWDGLRKAVGGRLIEVVSPIAAAAAQDEAACDKLADDMANPYYLGDEAGMTQSMGWAGAWMSQSSTYAVACKDADDVAEAVRFGRKHRLRLVVKGGGHSYQGTSCAPDSLLIWTRPMRAIEMHEAFVGSGCTAAPVPAVTVDAGALWMHTYNAVTTKGRRYVQGGGCATVGVAGLVQSGGFGSMSKRYGLAAASLLEAQIVTADGVVRTANACTDPDLFWAIKGGGGGSLGVVTKVTLRTHALPEFFGAVQASISAKSNAAYQRLIEAILAFYAEKLFNPHWGEQLVFRTQNRLNIRMMFEGLDKDQAAALWQPFFDWVKGLPGDYTMDGEARVVALPAHMLWDPKVLKSIPGAVTEDKRPGAPPDNVFWTGNAREAGKFIEAYKSTWVPATLLEAGQRKRLADALFASTRRAEMALHINKGLAGAPPEAIEAARDTAMNPAVLAAFALAICAGEQVRKHPKLPGHRPDMREARDAAADIDAAMAALYAVVPDGGAYVSESDYFQKDWQQAFWGSNYERLLAVKRKYDPEGLFFVRHGVGSEGWSEDGFTRMA